MLTDVNLSPAPPAFLAAADPRACVHTVHRRTRGRFTLSVLTEASTPRSSSQPPRRPAPPAAATVAEVVRRSRSRPPQPPTCGHISPLQAASPPPSLAPVNGALGNNSEGSEGEKKRGEVRKEPKSDQSSSPA
ncbi:hypothetical protein MUK42_37811 [Musa troglodytarum]|uniref:Uncharacterized protein n=1 Tax=Musa troglodytarum TaxID=320322 RepID=A0A9E7ECV7_9LILI|nr:hypothetical protein MUK42_37811 [Musa troglodytarum]